MLIKSILILCVEQSIAAVFRLVRLKSDRILHMIAVHGGVGLQQTGVEDICGRAIQEARGDAIEAIKFLETDGRTNCGYGSSLNEDGVVEVEAGYMSSRSLTFGAVGALKISRHPSLLAKKLALARLNASARLVAPMLVVGEGADRLATADVDVSTCSNASLISDFAFRAHEKARIALNEETRAFDTVGVCSIKEDGEAEACTSSGGIEMKKSGRLGHAAHFGAGCWAQKSGERSVAISLTGCGEALATTRLAQRIAENLLSTFVRVRMRLLECALKICSSASSIRLTCVADVVASEFSNSPLLEPLPPRRRQIGGIIVARDETADDAELIIFHNVRHLPFAYTHDGAIYAHLSKLCKGQPIRFDSFALK